MEEKNRVLLSIFKFAYRNKKEEEKLLWQKAKIFLTFILINFTLYTFLLILHSINPDSWINVLLPIYSSLSLTISFISWIFFKSSSFWIDYWNKTILQIVKIWQKTEKGFKENTCVKIHPYKKVAFDTAAIWTGLSFVVFLISLFLYSSFFFLFISPAQNIKQLFEPGFFLFVINLLMLVFFSRAFGSLYEDEKGGFLCKLTDKIYIVVFSIFVICISIFSLIDWKILLPKEIKTVIFSFFNAFFILLISSFISYSKENHIKGINLLNLVNKK